IKRRIFLNYKMFFTPLEISKFFQCPRRLWLEKIVLAKQEKEKVGKVWDGESLHLAIKTTIENLGKKEEGEVIEEAVNYAVKSFQGLIEIGKDEMKEIIKKFLKHIRDEKFELVLSERTIFSFRLGLVGSIDVIAFRNEEIIPIEIKHAFYKAKIKKEHILQSVGEALLLGNYFRREIKQAYIFYSQSNSLIKLDILSKHLKYFMKTIGLIKRMYSSVKIPQKSKLPNYKERVCKGCHVRNACENIERLRKKN
ncbi:MAG: Dna2/Cas4 domain-containing protein, partial [Candidatus Aenigmatarchaeota archaeon]